MKSTKKDVSTKISSSKVFKTQTYQNKLTQNLNKVLVGLNNGFQLIGSREGISLILSMCLNFFLHSTLYETNIVTHLQKHSNFNPKNYKTQDNKDFIMHLQCDQGKGGILERIQDLNTWKFEEQWGTTPKE